MVYLLSRSIVVFEAFAAFVFVSTIGNWHDSAIHEDSNIATHMGGETASMIEITNDKLPERAVLRLGTNRLRFPERITAVAFDKSGKWIVSGSSDRHDLPNSYDSLNFWDAKSGKLIKSFRDTGYYIGDLRFAKDGKRLFLIGTRVLRVWDMVHDKGQILYSGGRLVDRIHLLPDEKHVATKIDHRIELREITTGKLVRTFKGIRLPGRIDISADGKYVLAGGSSGQIAVWDLATARLRHKLSVNQFVDVVALSNCGKYFAASADRVVYIWANSSGKLLHKCRGHLSDVVELRFSPDGCFLASASRDSTIRLWDVRNGTERRRMQSHNNPIRCIAFDKNGKLLLSGSSEHLIQLWSVKKGKLLAGDQGHQGTIKCMVVDGKRERIYTASADGTIRSWNIKTGKEIDIVARESVGIGCMAITRDGNRLAWIGWDAGGQLTIYDLNAQKVIWRKGFFDYANSLAFTPDGQNLAISASQKIWVLNIERKNFRTIRTKEGLKLSHVAISPDGRHLATGSGRNMIHLWELKSGRVIGVCRGHQFPVRQLAFSNDGKSLASASADQTVRLWDVATCRQKRVLVGHRGSVESLAFSPNGKTLISGGCDWEIIMWDCSSAKIIRRYSGHRGVIYGLSYIFDGKQFVSVSGDQTGLVWNADGEK